VFRAKKIARALAIAKANARQKNEKIRRRYATDPEYRRKVIEHVKARYRKLRSDPESMKLLRQKQKESLARRLLNPEFRKKHEERRLAADERRRVKSASDAQYREKVNSQQMKLRQSNPDRYRGYEHERKKALAVATISLAAAILKEKLTHAQVSDAG
jgi:hypothetical protein